MKRKPAGEPTRETLLQAFRATPPAFAEGIGRTLRTLQNKEEPPMKKKISLGLVAALCSLLLLTGLAYAASVSPTLDFLGWFYGEDYLNDTIRDPQIAPVGETFTLGDLTYTLSDVVYSNGALYGSGTVAVTGGFAALMCPDYAVTDPHGYTLHYGKQEEIAPDHPSYAALAQEKDAPILMAQIIPNGYMIDGQLYCGDIGYNILPAQPNNLEFWFEVYAAPDDPTAAQRPLSDGLREQILADGGDPDTYKNPGIAPAQTYTLSLHVSCWEVAQDGTWLRDGDGDTRRADEWIVTVTPQETK